MSIGRFVAILQLSVMFCIASVASADESGVFEAVEDPVAILKMVVNQSKANYERIKTWQGDFTFRESQYFDSSVQQDLQTMFEQEWPEESVRSSKCQMSFFIDTKRDKLALRYKMLETKYHKTDFQEIITSRPPVLSEFASIVTPESYMSFDAVFQHDEVIAMSEYDQVIGRIAFVFPHEKADHTFVSDIPDPRFFFKDGKNYFWDYFGFIIEYFKEKPFDKKDELPFSFSVEKTPKGDYFRVIVITKHKEREVKNSWRINADCFFNVDEYSVESRSLDDSNVIPIHHMSLKYSKVDGVAVPVAATIRLGNSNGKNYSLTRIFEANQIQINKKIPDSVFTTSFFGLKERERVFDTVKNVLYEVRDGEVVEAVKKGEIAYSSNGTYGFVRLIFIVIGAVLILLGLVGTASKKYNKIKNSK